MVQVRYLVRLFAIAGRRYLGRVMNGRLKSEAFKLTCRQGHSSSKVETRQMSNVIPRHQGCAHFSWYISVKTHSLVG